MDVFASLAPGNDVCIEGYPIRALLKVGGSGFAACQSR